jgi:perosamine synthetase
MCIELENKKDYNTFLKDTNRANIMTRPVWELMSKLPMYSRCQGDSQKNAITLKDRIINIPSGVR